MILWTVALEHHDVPAARAMANRTLGLVRPGGIILMHDGGSDSRAKTVEALPMLLDGLKQKGYRCVTVPELLKIQGDTEIRPAERQAGQAAAEPRAKSNSIRVETTHTERKTGLAPIQP